MNKKIFFGMLATIVAAGFTSCYNNKADVTTPEPTISFVNEIAPIFTSGACGCHNNGLANNQKQFSNLYKEDNGGDTIYYDVIYGTQNLMESWAKGGVHPGYGNVELTPAEIALFLKWVAQGAPDDQGSGSIGGNVTYAANIAPIVSSTCAGGSCHGGAGPTLNYTALSSTYSSQLQGFINSNWSGHPAKLSATVTATLKAWIDQGKKP
jgi:hypothetical protein